MSRDCLFLDTGFVQARLNAADQHHSRAMLLAPRVHKADEVWTTEAVLVEIGNAFSAMNRAVATNFIDALYRTPNSKIVSVDSALFRRALDLYRARPDKAWGMTDCISFVVMTEHNLTEALTPDKHFVQAGFKALLAP